MMEFDLQDMDLVGTISERLGYTPDLTFVTVSFDLGHVDNSFDHAFGREFRESVEPKNVELVVQEQAKEIREVLLDEKTVAHVLSKKELERLYILCDLNITSDQN